MAWEDLQQEILEDIAGHQLHWEDDASFATLQRVHQLRKAKQAAAKAEWVWRRRKDPDFKARRRFYGRGYWVRLSQDPVRLGAYREKQRKQKRDRAKRLAEENPAQCEERKARQAQASQRWRKRRREEDREKFLLERREERARRLAAMTPEQLEEFREKCRIRDRERRRRQRTPNRLL